MTMENPPHPGEVIKHQFVENENGKQIYSYLEASKLLGIGSIILKLLCMKSISMNQEIADALEENNKGSAEMWMSMQKSYDLSILENK